MEPQELPLQQQLESALKKTSELENLNRKLLQDFKLNQQAHRGQIERYRLLEHKLQQLETKSKSQQDLSLAAEQKIQSLNLQLQQERARNLQNVDEKEALVRQTREALDTEHQLKYRLIVQANELNELQNHVVMLKSMIKGHKGMLNETDREIKSNFKEIEALTLENCTLRDELQRSKEDVQNQICARNQLELECSRLRTEILLLAKQSSKPLNGTRIIAATAPVRRRGRCHSHNTTRFSSDIA